MRRFSIALECKHLFYVCDMLRPIHFTAGQKESYEPRMRTSGIRAVGERVKKFHKSTAAAQSDLNWSGLLEEMWGNSSSHVLHVVVADASRARLTTSRVYYFNLRAPALFSHFNLTTRGDNLSFIGGPMRNKHRNTDCHVRWRKVGAGGGGENETRHNTPLDVTRK